MSLAASMAASKSARSIERLVGRPFCCRIHSQYYFPPQLGNGVFRDVNENLANITLVVPDADSKVLYENTAVWKEFFAICEDIDQVESEMPNEGKFLRDGQLFIRKGDKVYDIHGQIIK